MSENAYGFDPLGSLDQASSTQRDEFPLPCDDRAGWRVAMAIRDTLRERRLTVDDVIHTLDPAVLGHLCGLAEALTVVWPYLGRFATTRDPVDDAYRAREVLRYALTADERCQEWSRAGVDPPPLGSAHAAAGIRVAALAAVEGLARAMSSPAGPPRIEALRKALPELRAACGALDADAQQHPSRYPYLHAELPGSAFRALRYGEGVRDSVDAAEDATRVAAIAARMRLIIANPDQS